MTFEHDYYRLIEYAHEITNERDDVITTAFGHPDDNPQRNYTVAVCLSTEEGAGWLWTYIPHTVFDREDARKRVHGHVRRSIHARWAAPEPPLDDLSLSEDRLSSIYSDYEGLTTAVRAAAALRATYSY